MTYVSTASSGDFTSNSFSPTTDYYFNKDIIASDASWITNGYKFVTQSFSTGSDIDGILLQTYSGSKNNAGILSATIGTITNSWPISSLYDVLDSGYVFNNTYGNKQAQWKYLKFNNPIPNPGTVPVTFNINGANVLAPYQDVEMIMGGSYTNGPAFRLTSGVTTPAGTTSNRSFEVMGESQGGYLSFPGLGTTKLSATSNGYGYSGDFYTCAWVYDFGSTGNTGNANRWDFITMYTGAACGNQNRYFHATSGGNFQVYYDSHCSSSGYQTWNAVCPTGRWYFLLWQKQYNTWNLYVDGVKSTVKSGNLGTVSWSITPTSFNRFTWLNGAIGMFSENALSYYGQAMSDFTDYISRIDYIDYYFGYHRMYFKSNVNMGLVSKNTTALSSVPNNETYIIKPHYSRESNIANTNDVISITANNNQTVYSMVLDKAELKFNPEKKVSLTVTSNIGIQLQEKSILTLGTEYSPVLSTGYAKIIGSNPSRLDVSENSKITMYGAPKQKSTYLVSDTPASNRIFKTTDNISSWLSGDTVLFFYDKGGAKFETLTVSSVSANAFSTTTSNSFNISGMNSIVHVPAVYNITRNVGYNSLNGCFTVSKNASAFIVNSEIKDVGTNSLDNNMYNRVTNTASFILSSSVYHSPNVVSPGTQGMLYLDGGSRNVFITADNIFYRLQKSWIAGGMTFTKPSNFSNNFFLSGQAEGFQFYSNNIYHPLYFQNNVAIGNGYTGIAMRSNNIYNEYADLTDNIAIDNSYVGITINSNNLSSLSCGNSIGNRNNQTSFEIFNNNFYNGGGLYASNLSAFNSLLGYGVYYHNNKLSFIEGKDLISINNGGRGLHCVNHLQVSPGFPRYINLSGAYVTGTTGDRGVYISNNILSDSFIINNLTSFNNNYGLDIDTCTFKTLCADNIITRNNNTHGFRLAYNNIGYCNIKNLISVKNTNEGMYMTTATTVITSFSLDNVVISANTGHGLYIDGLNCLNDFKVTNFYSYQNGNNGAYYNKISCRNFITDNHILSGNGNNAGNIGSRMQNIYASDSFNANNLVSIKNGYGGFDFKFINASSFKVTNVLISGTRSSGYGMYLDTIGTSALDTCIVKNISSLSNPNYGLLCNTICARNIYLTDIVSQQNLGNGMSVYVKANNNKDIKIDISNNIFVSNTGVGCSVQIPDNYYNKTTVYASNILCKSNTTNGLSISGSQNNLNPVSINLFNSYLSSNSFAGLELLNGCGNISATEILDNKTYNIRASIGSGPVLIDSLTAYYNNVITNKLTGYGNGGLTLSSSSPFTGGNDSLYFNGTNYLVAPASNDYVLNGNFTIEFYLNLRNNAGCVYLDQWFGSSGWQLASNSSKTLQWFYDGSKFINGPVITLNQWNHIALVRNSNRLGLYVNGLSTAGAFFSGGMGRNDLFYIGAQRYLGPVFYAPMWMSNLRIVNNAALYTTLSFNPPSSKLGATAGNVSFLYQYPYGIPYTSYLGAATKTNISLSGINYHTFYIKNSKLHDSGFSYFSAPALFFDATNFKQFYIDNSNAGSSQLGTKSMTYGSYTFNNCAFNNIPLQNGLAGVYQPNTSKTTGWSYMNYNQTSGYHVTYYSNGSRMIDTSIYNDNYVSERLTPTNRTEKLKSGSKFVALNNGDSTFVSVFIRKSTLSADGVDYNGNPPRLILRRNVSMGIYDDMVLGEYVSTSDIFTPLINATPIVIDDGVLEFYVDCDGTQGWINIDSWSAQ